MCTTCGCGQGESKVEGEHTHVLPDGTVLRHVHGSGEAHAHSHVLGNGSTLTHTHSHHGEHAHEHTHVLPDGRVVSHSHGADTAHEHTHLTPDGRLLTHSHAHDDQDHEHGHDHLHAAGHDHGHEHDALHFGLGAARTHAPGLSQQQMVRIERDILSKNDEHAARNRSYLAGRGIFAVNLVSSPGSGKTTLLVRTIEALSGRLPVTVIEGDQQTSNDADRIRATGARAIQVNTGKGCHLDAAMVERALGPLAPPEDSLLIIENVGNLVCPAAFDLGEAHKVVILSVTEGEDKPLKYPDMFLAADLMLLNKVDLLPHLSFDLQRCVEYARRVKPGIQVMQVSATTGEGFDAWIAWLQAGAQRARETRGETVEALRRRVAQLEAELAKRG